MFVTLFLVSLASWWLWETIRYALEAFLPADWYALSRPVHPVIVLLFPLMVLWPNYVMAMAAAALVAVYHALLDRIHSDYGAQPISFKRNRQPSTIPLLPGRRAR